MFDLKIESGEDLISDVNYTIDNTGLLTLNDNNQCNWVRNYAPTKIFVTTPNLKLISENFNEDNMSSGDFNLRVQNESISVISNNISQFFISGSTDTLFVGFYSGTTAFFGANLLAQDDEISHRSSHDITAHPVQSLSGVLRSTGNLISVNEPPNVDVSELYTGSLIYIN
jgi:hypothetical protein